jgi:superfamily II DNA or RNA helicase
MDYDIVLTKVNEVYLRVSCEAAISMELYEYCSFYATNYRYSPLYKKKKWNGKIYLYSYITNLIYGGLVHYIKKFAQENNYTLYIDKSLIDKTPFTLENAKQFISTLNIPFEVRDYQLESFVKSIKNKKLLLLSNTSSGKSLVIYLIIRYLQLHHKKGLLIVPSLNLISQMYNDFSSYGYDSAKYCHKIYSGQEKLSSKFLNISTYQSLANIVTNKSTLDKSYFEQFDFVIVDECHQGETKSITGILSSCINAEYRIGTTGTLKNTNINTLTLVGLFGPIYQATTTQFLIDNKYISDFRIKCLTLKYDEVTAKQTIKFNYTQEFEFLISNVKRNVFIRNLALSLTGVTLVLFQYVEKHGKLLYDMIKNSNSNCNVYYISGEIDSDERERIRNICLNETNAIIVASYGVYSTGVNIPTIENIIFASPSKSRIRVLQSIGRMLRLSENKKIATLYDIADDLRYKKHVNFTLKHFLERLKIYNTEKFNYQIYNFEFNNNDEHTRK